MKVKVAVLQYDVPEDSDASFKKLNEMVMQASWAGASLIVAPETAVGGFKEVKERDTDYLARLSEIVKKHKVFLATSFYTKKDNKLYNQGYIIAPSGKSVLHYRKLYLAKPEVDDGITSGNKLGIADTQIGKLGMIICKDGFNKFSHFLYEKLNFLGAEIICIPSWSISWSQMNTQEYIRVLYTYGAFASRSFVLLSGNLNISSNSFGRSLIISPIRGVLKEGSTNHKEILYEELDLDEVKKAREFDSWWQPKKKVDIK